MELLPPRIADRDLLALLGEMLAPQSPHRSGGPDLRLMRQGFVWQELVDLASQHDVLPPLIHMLSAKSLLPPEPRVSSKLRHASHVTSRLAEIYQMHLDRRQRQLRQLSETLELLESKGVQPLLLKGARYLLAPSAIWCEARTIRDIDLLVRPDEGDAAFVLLEQAGYRRCSPEKADHHHYPALQREGEPCSIEIHTGALAAEAEPIMSTDFVWQNAIAGAGSFVILPERWQALHCLLHHQVSDHGYARRILAIKPLWEWAMLSSSFSTTDWADIAKHMKMAGAMDVLGSWLLQAESMLGCGLPDQICISSAARANAEATFRRSAWPHVLRRSAFVADQLRYSFSREALGRHYGKPVSQISIGDAGRYLVHLLRLHRGHVLQRLTGDRDRMA